MGKESQEPPVAYSTSKTTDYRQKSSMNFPAAVVLISGALLAAGAVFSFYKAVAQEPNVVVQTSPTSLSSARTLESTISEITK